MELNKAIAAGRKLMEFQDAIDCGMTSILRETWVAIVDPHDSSWIAEWQLMKGITFRVDINGAVWKKFIHDDKSSFSSTWMRSGETFIRADELAILLIEHEALMVGRLYDDKIAELCRSELQQMEMAEFA